MTKYIVFKENQQWEIEADNLSQAEKKVLEDEGYKIYLNTELESTVYYQRDSRYKNVKIGKSNLSFQNYGCFICSLAYMVKRDPLVVMKELVEKGGVNNEGLVVSAKAAEILGLDLLKGDDKYIAGKMNDINYMPKFECIKEVYLGKSQHFVVRLIDNNGKRLIFDPWEGKYLPINHYTFRSYRLFKTK